MPDQKEIILHIGFPKTATSTIQCYLADNHANLALHKVLYPLFDDTVSLENNSRRHSTIPIALMRERPQHFQHLDNESLNLAFTSLLEYFRYSSYTKLILSDEIFTQGVPLDLDRLTAATEDFSVTCLSYVREYDRWIESYFAWYLAHGYDHTARTFAEFTPRLHMRTRTFSNVLRRLKNKYQRIDLLPSHMMTSKTTR